MPPKTERKYRHVSASDVPSSSSVSTLTESATIDWDLCVLCQTRTRDKLVCPARRAGDGYTYVAENLQKFLELGLSPIPVDICKLNEGDGFEETFRFHSALWHKRCRLKISDCELKAAVKRDQQDPSSCHSPVKTRKHDDTSSNSQTDNACFFCGKNDGKLHEASALHIDYKVRQCALDLQDRHLLAKLSAGDMVAIDAVYHNLCLAQLYKRADRHRMTERTESDDNSFHAVAFVELVSYVETFRDHKETAPVFSMPQLCKLYTNRLAEYGLQDSEIHSTRLRERLQAAIPDLVAAYQGREYVLMFDKDIGDAIKKACSQDSEVLHFAKAAQLIRREMFKLPNTFNGTFERGCQDNAVPFLLKALVSMILHGPETIDGTNKQPFQNQAVLSIAQLLAFNAKKKAPTSTTAHARHSQEQEPPLPVYLGLKVHSLTRKKELVDTLHTLGMGISYSRVLAISTEIANTVCKKFEVDGVVVPPQMTDGMFTAGVVDNIDINPSSTTSTESFHGTSISLIQNGAKDSDRRQDFISVFDQSVKGRTHVAQLPLWYTDIAPLAFARDDLFPPPCKTNLQVTIRPETTSHTTEYTWLEHCRKTIGEDCDCFFCRDK